jgi:rare lipoprotein A
VLEPGWASGNVDPGAPVHPGGPLELMDMRTTVLAPLALVAVLQVVGSALGQGSDDAAVFEEEGQASYYGERFHGRPTASGEPFDQDAMTAAHPELPLGAEVTVTDPSTGKQVEVEVNDRGPYVDGRDIDLSQGAAKRLGTTQKGVAAVRIEATKRQAEEAIDGSEEVPKVERQLEDARRAAAAEGTPQPEPLPALEPPPSRPEGQ